MRESTRRIQEALFLLRQYAGGPQQDAALAYMRAQIANAQKEVRP